MIQIILPIHFVCLFLKQTFTIGVLGVFLLVRIVNLYAIIKLQLPIATDYRSILYHFVLNRCREREKENWGI